MRPLLLKGHERAITQIKYNREGDLIFSAAKDAEPSIWYSVNGERLGTFKGHKGAVWSVDVDWQTRRAVTGGGDFKVGIWSVETGVPEHFITYRAAVRSVGFSYSGNLICVSTSGVMKQSATIRVHDLRAPETFETRDETLTSVFELPLMGDRIEYGMIQWSGLDDIISVGTTDGALSQVSVKSRNFEKTVKDHHSQIKDIQANREQTLLITASKDQTAKLYNARTLECLKKYKTEKPVNSAAISPTRRHVVLGGGQEAMEVTTSATESGKFEARFYHMVFEEEFARVAGHFGPINSVAYHPDGNSYCSGAEDGYLRVHKFGDDYLKFTMEGEEENYADGGADDREER